MLPKFSSTLISSSLVSPACSRTQGENITLIPFLLSLFLSSSLVILPLLLPTTRNTHYLMEQKPQNAIISINPNATTNPPSDDEPKPNHCSHKKRHGSTNILKVALFMIRGRSRKSKALPVDVGSKSIWRKLVGSMRPLHLQGNQSPPQHPQAKGQPLQMITLTPPSPSENNTDHGEDGFDSASEFPNSPSPPSSRYASAVGLNELVDEDCQKEEEIVKECEEHDDGNGDEMIDAKAEEFIAEFYLQMRLQRLDSMDHRYKEISLRSLGL